MSRLAPLVAEANRVAYLAHLQVRAVRDAGYAHRHQIELWLAERPEVGTLGFGKSERYYRIEESREGDMSVPVRPFSND